MTERSSSVFSATSPGWTQPRPAGEHYTRAFASTVRIDPGLGLHRELFDRLVYETRVSPDGKTLAYLTDDHKLMLRPLAGGEATLVPGLVGEPVWAPDSRSFLCSDVLETNTGTWRVSLPGLERTRLNLPKNHMVHDWSPDGQWLVSGARSADGAGSELHRMTLDGTLGVKLASGGYNSRPRISPDGTKVVHTHFLQVPAPRFEVVSFWIVNSDGTGSHKLAEGLANNDRACWSPDGRTLLLKKNLQLSLIDRDGSNPRPLGLRWKSRQPLFSLPTALGGQPNDCHWIGAVEWLH